MPSFPRPILALLATLFFVFAVAHAQAQTYTKIVVFGDSLSDTGNIAHLTEAQFFVTFPSHLFNYTDGRFTDGPDTTPAAHAYQGVWVEQLARAFAAPPTIKNSLDGGTNYAYGDATTADGTRVVTTTVPGIALPVTVTVNDMGQQVTDYLATSPTPDANTLYVLFGGANDLFADDSAAGVTATAQRIAALVQRLVTAGATDFLIPNLPPLGGVPNYASTPQATALTLAAASFKAQLAAGLQAVIATAQASNITLRIAQPDIFTQFATAATTPMSLALANVTDKAQDISGNPDTYLIWDGLHPTTTGHHFLAAAAENILHPLIADPVLRFSLSSNTAVAGQLVTFSAQIIPPPCPTPGCAIPTGLVTFFSGTGTTATAIASATLDSTGSATATFTPSSSTPSPTTITAVYAGDTTYLNTSLPPQTLTVLATAAATTTTLTSSSLNANQGASIAFTATVTSAAGTPSGTVAFLDGTTTLGTAVLNSAGVATYTTSTLSAGSPHSITATYAASGIFAGSTSAALTETITASALTVALSPTSLTIASGSSGSTQITYTPQGGFAGTITPACSNLPAHLSCTFAPTTVTLAGTTAQTVTLTIATNVPTATALVLPPHPASRPPETFYAVTMLPLFGLGTLALRRRRLSRLALTLCAATLTTGLALALTGCFGGGSSNNAAPGTYNVNISYTLNGSAAAGSGINLAVTVQ